MTPRRYSVWRQHKAGAAWIEISEDMDKLDAMELVDRINARAAEDPESTMVAVVTRTGQTPAEL